MDVRVDFVEVPVETTVQGVWLESVEGPVLLDGTILDGGLEFTPVLDNSEWGDALLGVPFHDAMQDRADREFYELAWRAHRDALSPLGAPLRRLRAAVGRVTDRAEIKLIRECASPVAS